MSDSNRYKDRIGESSEQYALNQLKDLGDAVSETLRLWKDLYGAAATGQDDILLGKWAELASATIHYSAALATNYGAFVTGVGAPLMPGNVDSHVPERAIRLPNAQDPECRLARRVGSAHSVPHTCVSLHQNPDQHGTDEWTITFDLRNNPQRGTYYFRIAPGPNRSDLEFHEYLDPTP